MGAFQLAAAVGLVSLLGGMLVVNRGTSPRVAQAGTIVAAFGIVMLVMVALRQLLV